MKNPNWSLWNEDLAPLWRVSARLRKAREEVERTDRTGFVSMLPEALLELQEATREARVMLEERNDGG